jgi:hypothetical protein
VALPHEQGIRSTGEVQVGHVDTNHTDRYAEFVRYVPDTNLASTNDLPI